MVVFIRDSSKVPTFDAGHDASSSPPRFPGTVTRTPHPHSPSIPPSRQRVEKPRSKPRARPPPTLRNRVSDRNIDLVLALHFCELWSSLTQWWRGDGGTQPGTVGTVSDDAWMEERCLSPFLERSTRNEVEAGRHCFEWKNDGGLLWNSCEYERLMILKKESIEKAISIGEIWNRRMRYWFLS